MNVPVTRSITLKLLAASLLLLLLAAFAQRSGVSAALLSRLVLGLLACAGLAAWLVKARRAGGHLASRPFQLPPRLGIAARVSLSARCGLALVEADGRRYLVAHGDGFAHLLNALPPRAPVQARAGRRPLPGRAARSGGRP